MSNLTEREIQVMNLVCKGLSAREIGKRLGISHRTVEEHTSLCRDKLSARNTVQAAVIFALGRAG